jgi:hypothetical protein
MINGWGEEEDNTVIVRMQVIINKFSLQETAETRIQ